MLVLYFVTLFVCGTFGLATTIPFLGITQSAPAGIQNTVQKEGQLITGVSQITSFSFYVASPYASSQTGEASVGLWSSSGVSVIQTVSVTFPVTTSYSKVTANIQVSGLDPRKTYVIYFTFPASILSQFALAQLTNGGTSGGVSYYAPPSTQIGVNYWTPTNLDYIFTLVSDNTIAVPNTNYASGPGNNPNRWGCIYKTTFTQIQVNWQTLLVNTAFVGTSTTTLLSGSSCASSGVFVPYSTAGSCSYSIAEYAVIDLSGTILKVADTFSATGYYPTGTVSSSNNGQTYTISIVGWCGTEVTSEALAAGGGTVSGFYLQLAYA